MVPVAVAVGGILAVTVVAVVVAARLGRSGWWRFVLAGAAGWAVAQVVKGVLVAPVTLLGVRHGGAAQLAAHWWFIGLGALLPGVVEELGKYVPLRWLRVRNRGSALALGLGAGAFEALTLMAALFAPQLAAHETMAGALIAVWERFWAVALHAGEAALDGVAVVRRRIRWLVVAMALHTAADLGAAWYQHQTATGARGSALQAPLAVAEVAVAALAIATWWWSARLWAKRVDPEAP